MNQFAVKAEVIAGGTTKESHYVRLSIQIDGTPIGEQHTVDVMALLGSLCEDGQHYIFTCSCGISDCAGIEQGVKVNHRNGLVTWRIMMPISMGDPGSDEDYDHWCATAVVHEYVFERRQMILAINPILANIRSQVASKPGKVEFYPDSTTPEDFMKWEAGKMPFMHNTMHPQTRYYKVTPNQRIDPQAITLCPDYGGGWAWDDEPPGGEGRHIQIGDGEYWVGFCPLPVDLVKSAAGWELDFATAPIDDKLHALLDWETFHLRGRELAIEIKRVLGAKVQIIYQKPIEDPNYQEQERIEVFSDGSFIELPSLAKVTL